MLCRFDGGYQGDLQSTIAKMLRSQSDAVGFGGMGVTPNPVGWVGTVSLRRGKSTCINPLVCPTALLLPCVWPAHVALVLPAY